MGIEEAQKIIAEMEAEKLKKAQEAFNTWAMEHNSDIEIVAQIDGKIVRIDSILSIPIGFNIIINKSIKK